MNYAWYNSDDSSFRTEMSVFCAGKDFSFMALSSYFLLNEKNLPSYLERLRKNLSILPDLLRSTADQQLYIVAYVNSVCTMYCENMSSCVHGWLGCEDCMTWWYLQHVSCRGGDNPRDWGNYNCQQGEQGCCSAKYRRNTWRLVWMVEGSQKKPHPSLSLLFLPSMLTLLFTQIAPKDCSQFPFASKQHRNLFVQLFARTSIK